MYNVCYLHDWKVFNDFEFRQRRKHQREKPNFCKHEKDSVTFFISIYI